jgi:hypothetical protein
VAASAVRVHRRDPGLGTGLASVVGVWAVACALDWHWEMPAVTLPALLAAAALVARADPPLPDPSGDHVPAAAERPAPVESRERPADRDGGEHDEGDLGRVTERREAEAREAGERHDDRT